ncbi:MAG TPA: GNAT family N-acetyltransferase [Mycobacteriales bacterium]|nr:GNAT family N-acetyltransferase [Mycobacteriales bacterium]
MELRSVTYEQALPLVDALSSELTIRYGGGPASVADPSDFVPPYGRFFVVTVDGQDVACGGVRRLTDEIGEVKRMYVEPSARGRGLSRLVLSELVAFARSAGYRFLWLETGLRQPEAIALYESAGFAPIDKYGQYKDEPESRCYSLAL